jgi:hypothetical protein
VIIIENCVFSDVVELLPDSGWKDILRRIIAPKTDDSELSGYIPNAHAPSRIVTADYAGYSEGLIYSWEFSVRDAYYYTALQESGTVREIAREPEQFMFAWIKDNHGQHSKISEMAQLLGFPDVMSVIEHYRHDRTFKEILEMQRCRPLAFVRDDELEEQYEGMAPCFKNLTPESVREWTVPETNSEAFNRATEETLLPAVRNSGFAPPWFLTEDQQTVFYKLLRSGDHQGAWMSLNSSQWTMEDARRAILELAKEVERPLFKEFARAWVALPFPDDWWY